MSDSGTGDSRPRGLATLMSHISLHKIDFALWLTRIVTMVFTLLYIIPVFGNPYVSYQRALISNAATCALRLHQRLPRVQLSREFLGLLLLEDSCHYLFFSIVFLYSYPITLALLPIFLFAVLHAASYTLTLLDQLGQNAWWGARLLISLVEFQQRNMLRLIAFGEIFLMPLAIIMIFMGRTSLLVPFMYYRFLALRYSSRRNPFTRQVFNELRCAVEMLVNRPACPAGIRSLVLKIIAFICRMAPPAPQAQQ